MGMKGRRQKEGAAAGIMGVVAYRSSIDVFYLVLATCALGYIYHLAKGLQGRKNALLHFYICLLLLSIFLQMNFKQSAFCYSCANVR
jgi:hypothetical protein